MTHSLKPHRRALLAAAPLMALVAATRARAQEPSDAQKEIWRREAEERLHSDWAYLRRYQDDNARLKAEGRPVDVVFLGDSITEGWVAKSPAFFKPGRVGRGISGQTTPQMLVRLRADVIDLKPRAVHIMAGTNDIAQNTGPMTPEQTQGNIQTMVELAKAHGIKVILASVPPSDNLFWNPSVKPVAPKIQAANAWLRDYADKAGVLYADYWSLMADDKGAMKPGYAYDGVHPTEQGYQAIQPLTEKLLRTVLGA